jgi:hypothetical protein
LAFTPPAPPPKRRIIRQRHDYYTYNYFGQSSFSSTLANNNEAASSATTTTTNNTREVQAASIEAVNKQQKLLDNNLRPTSESNSSSSNNNISCHRVDIVLNRNAKGVTSKVIQLVQDVVSSLSSSQSSNTNVQIHITSTINEATHAVASMIHNPPKLIIAVGGDGTITTLLQLLWDLGMDTSSSCSNCDECNPTTTTIMTTTNSEETEAADEATAAAAAAAAAAKRRRRFPPIGYIAQGTGNALGSVIGARPTVDSTSSSSSSRILQRLRRRIVVRGRKESRLRDTLHQLLQTVGQLSQQQQHRQLTNNFDIVELPMIQVTTTTTTNTTTSIINDKEYEPSSKQKQQQQQQKIQNNNIKYNNRRSELCFFSGVGFDSLLLQDYKDLQHWTNSCSNNSSSNNSSNSSNIINNNSNTNEEVTTLQQQQQQQQQQRRLPNIRKLLFRDTLSSVFGYFVAFLTRTLPNCVKQKHIIHVKVQTSDIYNTVWVDHRRGDLVRKVIIDNEKMKDNNDNDNEEDDKLVLLYQGNAGIVAASTTPYYGGGLRLFPFARMSLVGMQLRIGRIHPIRGTLNLLPIFSGSYRDIRDDTFGCLDFMGTHFQIDILQPTIGYPLQHSGEFVGLATCIEYEMMNDMLHPIQFVTLLPPRLIC